MSTRAPQLGLLALTALVVGNMIGSGTFLLPSALAPYGLDSLWGWLITTGGAVLLALVFARLARERGGSGGPQLYARAAFGDVAGFIVGWCYWVSSWCGLAAIAIAFAGNLAALWPQVNSTPVHAAVTAAAGIVVCLGFNLSGLRAASAVQILTATLKLLPLLALGVCGWLWFDPQLATAPLQSPTPDTLDSGWAAASAVAALTLWAFLGLECATVPAGAVRDPARTVPRATVIGTLLAGLASVLACTVVLGLVPRESLLNSTAPLVDAARATWGNAAGILMAVAAVIACFGAINGWVLIQAQVAAAAARDGLFPRWLASSDALAVPKRALWLGSTLAIGLVAANASAGLVQVYTFSILLSTAACLLPFVVCTLAALKTAVHTPQRVIAVLATVYSLWALFGTGTTAIGWGLVLVACGLPVWLGVRYTTPKPPTG